MSQQQAIPVMVLKEGTGRTRGKSAQRNNIMAARIIGEIIRSTLGPRGMDKMLVDSLGDVTVSNDGATILKEIDVEHPAAKMMVEAAKTQDNIVGDGTTSVVILASELLKKAEELLDQNIHPTVIVGGYRKAADQALKELGNIAVNVDIKDKDTLKKIALTAIRGKTVAAARDLLIDIAIKAVEMIAEKRDDRWVVDVDQVQIIKKPGGSIFDTRLVQGLIIDKEVVHAGMPKRIENAKIVLLDCPLEVEKTEMSAEIRIRDPSQMKAFLDEETRILKEMVGKIKAVGANVAFCQKGIDDIAQYFLAKEGILAVRRVKKSDMEKLARATGGRIITNLDDLKEAELGYAELVEERKIGDDKMVFVEGCKNPRSVGILIRGGLERFVDEAERAIHDALSVVADVYEYSKIVAGGGAVEAELAKRLRDYARKVGGREQLAIEAFADSIESIPRTLAENAGLDPIDILVDMRSKHEKPEGIWVGVDVFEGKTADMMKLNVVEPAKVKEQAIKSAVEAASMILRIDDVIAAAKQKLESKKGESPKLPEY
ncbi:MAG: thermosome subunit [Candidatus Hecatellales archaeon ex4484_218]|nr:MAG: thermosome subunit [Candidatus Hecatellales archaeon ex4484_218]